MGDTNNGEDGFEVGGWYPFMDYSPISCQGFTVDSLEASRVFPIGGDGGVPPPAKNLLISLPTWKNSSPADSPSPYQIFISSPPKVS